MTRTRSGTRCVRRQGLIALEAVMSLAVFFTIAMVAYYLAQRSFGELYQLIAVMVGSPYL